MSDLRKVTRATRACPVCGSIDTRQTAKFTTDDVAHWICRPSDLRFSAIREIAGQIWQQPNASLFACSKCGFHFADPYLPGNQEIYSFIYTGSQGYCSWKWDYEVTWSLLKEKKKITNLSFLEIGAGNGAFIKRTVPELFSAENSVCTEYSEYSRQEISKFGVRVLSTNLVELPDALNKTFDVICGFQVIEHLVHPHEVFSALHRLSKPGGHIFLTVPNNLRRNQFDLHGVHQDVPPIHVCRYSLEAFQLLAQQHGFLVVEHRYQSTFRKDLFIDFARSIYSKRRNNPFYLKFKLPKLTLLPLMAYSVINAFWVLTCRRPERMGISQWIHLQRME